MRIHRKYLIRFLVVALVAVSGIAFSNQLFDYILSENQSDISKKPETKITETVDEVANIAFIKRNYISAENGEWIDKEELKNVSENYISEQNKKAQDAVTMLKNEADFFPFTTHNYSGLVISIGQNSFPFTSMMSNLTSTQIVSFASFASVRRDLKKFKTINQLLIAVHITKENVDSLALELDKLHALFPSDVKTGLIVFGSPDLIKNTSIASCYDAIVLAYENSSFVQNRGAQIICGALPMKGKLPFNLNVFYPKGTGITYNALNRLSFIDPDELNIEKSKLNKIDSFVEQSIADGVFPSCQVAFAYKGKVVYNKSFGKMTYEGTQTVKNDDIYDLASVTKVVSSTAALMFLQSQGKFTLDKKLSDYLSELVENSTVKNVGLRSLMAHQAGFVPYFPFYKQTISNGVWKPEIYNAIKTDFYSKQVANDMWIDGTFRDTMMAEILRSPLKTPGQYKYSDVGYYFVQRIIEKLSGNTQDQFVLNNLYKQLGLNRTGYNPLTFYPLAKIAPTEQDNLFRKQLVHGFVHDPGAAMQGGVAGHAGVFSNATDLLAILQLFLNKGSYAGKQLLKREVVEEYTKAQISGNRRGAGFDRPTASGDNGPVCSNASQLSYGHSGFTGTYVWVDPKNELTFVFLSNRVYPDAENWKIVKQKTRSKIHQMIYELTQGK
ncbi:MAG TPA: serine hydrolase [Crocinitomicaceae bacterium]|nr:serine hydrolase [Crocinitomicaceae bacterium]